MKQLYIRKGNLESNQNILIIGEEAELGSRDSAYKAKGTLHDRFLVKRDSYTGAENLIYIHACKNIFLNSETFTRDYDIHRYLKSYCKDLLKWDGEADQGVTDSREAFVVRNGDTNKTVKILRERIQALVEPVGLFETIKSSRVYHKTHKKKKLYRAKKTYKSKRKAKIIFLILIFIISLCFYIFRSCSEGFHSGAYDISYDYRNKMSDENDEWLLNKCHQIIVSNDGKTEWVTEAYYSNRFSGFSNYRVHFYKDSTVIRIKRNLSESEEQTAIRSACKEVMNHQKK